MRVPYIRTRTSPSHSHVPRSLVSGLSRGLSRQRLSLSSRASPSLELSLVEFAVSSLFHVAPLSGAPLPSRLRLSPPSVASPAVEPASRHSTLRVSSRSLHLLSPRLIAFAAARHLGDAVAPLAASRRSRRQSPSRRRCRGKVLSRGPRCQCGLPNSRPRHRCLCVAANRCSRCRLAAARGLFREASSLSALSTLY